MTGEEAFEKLEQTVGIYLMSGNADDTYCKEWREILETLKKEPKTGRCKDCKWWKDSDGVYRRGVHVESKCPINTKVVLDGEGYCYMFEPRGNDHKCHSCKHYISGEHDGSCGSYICKEYSNWENEDSEEV